MGVADEGSKRAVGNAWGDDISPERQAELEQRLQAWEQEADHHSEQRGPFDRGETILRLTGADVFWLAARTLARVSDAGAIAQQELRLRQAQHDVVMRTQLERATLPLSNASIPSVNLSGAEMLGADLSGAILSGANLSGADMLGANLSSAILSGANLSGAGMLGVNLSHANLLGAHLSNAYLLGANLSHATASGVDLSCANLREATLYRAYLYRANLSQAGLVGANLLGANLNGTDLSGADLRSARLNIETGLRETRLSTTTLLADVVWNSAPVSLVDWERLPTVGDATRAGERRDLEGKKKDAVRRLAEYEAAVRACRLLAVVLRSQGLNEHADRYAYRAQLMQRVVLRRQGQPLRWLGSLLLDTIAGYGYRPLRTLFWYLAVIGAFAFAYFQATHGALTFGLPPSHVQPLAWYEALVLSVSSFHGRGFFQPVQSLGDPAAILAAAEAVLGLFIEISFIATFTQRYFGK
ncbi:MAG TPA: pentapeptide repeat-containing protein [Ktedonobacterales bacterium]